MIRKLAVLVFFALACVVAWPTLTYAQSAIFRRRPGHVRRGSARRQRRGEQRRADRKGPRGGHRRSRAIQDRRSSAGHLHRHVHASRIHTFKRDGIELGADFTAQVNAELRVGSLEETVTVTGASPIVDVQSTSRAQVLNRDLLDAVPAGRSYQGYAQLVPGISLSSPDVGGEASMQNTYMSVHGASSANVTMQVDGQMINGLQSDGSVQSYFNNMMSEEMSFQTAGIGADTSGGGVRVNMIRAIGRQQVRRRVLRRVGTG